MVSSDRLVCLRVEGVLVHSRTSSSARLSGWRCRNGWRDDEGVCGWAHLSRSTPPFLRRCFDGSAGTASLPCVLTQRRQYVRCVHPHSTLQSISLLSTPTAPSHSATLCTTLVVYSSVSNPGLVSNPGIGKKTSR